MAGNILNAFAKFKTVAGQVIFGTGDIDVPSTGDLSAGLATKADLVHTHVKADITDFAHTHPQSEVTNLVTDLAGKQDSLVSGTNIKPLMVILY